MPVPYMEIPDGFCDIICHPPKLYIYHYINTEIKRSRIARIDNAYVFADGIKSKLVKPMEVFDGKNRLTNVSEAINMGYKMINETDDMAKAIECLDGMEFIYAHKIEGGEDVDAYGTIVPHMVINKGLVLIKAHEMANNKFEIPPELQEEYKQVVIKTYERMMYVFSRVFVVEEMKSTLDPEYLKSKKWGKLIFDLSEIKFGDKPILLETLEKKKTEWLGENDEIKISGNKVLFRYLTTILSNNYKPSGENTDKFLKEICP